MRLASTLLIISIASTTAASAQKIERGSIVLIQSPSGLHLSAHPADKLVWSPNVAQWEQWEVVQDGQETTFHPSRQTYLRSFHGTRLVLDHTYASTRAYHAPASLWDNGSVEPVTCTKESDGSEVTGYLPGGVATSSVHNSKIVLRGKELTSYMTEGRDGTPAMTNWTATSKQQVPPSGCFTILLVNSPGGNRVRRVDTLYQNTRYTLRSFHNTHVVLDESDGFRDNMPFIHLRPDPRPEFRRDLRFWTSRGDEKTPLLWGDREEIISEPPQMGSFVMTGHNGSVVHKSGSRTTWKFVDPTRQYPDGTRVPVGAHIVLQAESGGNLSADPALPNLRLSPNTAQWEWWRLCGPYDIPCN